MTHSDCADVQKTTITVYKAGSGSEAKTLVEVPEGTDWNDLVEHLGVDPEGKRITSGGTRVQEKKGHVKGGESVVVAPESNKNG